MDAFSAGATYAKFQKRCPRELLTEEQYSKPHPVPANAYGPTYGAHREFLEFNLAQHKEPPSAPNNVDLLAERHARCVTSAGGVGAEVTGR